MYVFVLVVLVHRHMLIDLVSGDILIGIIDSYLPFDGMPLILGNDLAGEKVTVNPVLCGVILSLYPHLTS